jgi:hypothetical protein
LNDILNFLCKLVQHCAYFLNLFKEKPAVGGVTQAGRVNRSPGPPIHIPSQQISSSVSHNVVSPTPGASSPHNMTAVTVANVSGIVEVLPNPNDDGENGSCAGGVENQQGNQLSPGFTTTTVTGIVHRPAPEGIGDENVIAGGAEQQNKRFGVPDVVSVEGFERMGEAFLGWVRRISRYQSTIPAKVEEVSLSSGLKVISDGGGGSDLGDQHVGVLEETQPSFDATTACLLEDRAFLDVLKQESLFEGDAVVNAIGFLKAILRLALSRSISVSDQPSSRDNDEDSVADQGVGSQVLSSSSVELSSPVLAEVCFYL